MHNQSHILMVDIWKYVICSGIILEALKEKSKYLCYLRNYEY